MPTKTKSPTVAQFLAALPEDRRKTIKALRDVIRKNVDPKVKESVGGHFLSWSIPHSVYPHGYHCKPSDPLPFVGIASQKRHIGIYLFCVYTAKDGPETFAREWKKTGKRLDMGKGCVRVTKLEDIPLDVVGRTIKRMTVKKFIAAYEAALPASVLAKRERQAAGGRKKAAGKKTTRRKAPRPKAAARKATTRKKAVRKKAAPKRAARKKAARKR